MQTRQMNQPHIHRNDHKETETVDQKAATHQKGGPPISSLNQPHRGIEEDHKETDQSQITKESQGIGGSRQQRNGLTPREDALLQFDRTDIGNT